MLLQCITNAQSNAVSFTQDDRDRIIRTETKLDERFGSFQKLMDDRFAQVDGKFAQIQKQMDEMRADMKLMKTDLSNFILWGFGVTFTGIFALVGFILGIGEHLLNHFKAKWMI